MNQFVEILSHFFEIINSNMNQSEIKLNKYQEDLQELKKMIKNINEIKYEVG